MQPVLIRFNWRNSTPFSANANPNRLLAIQCYEHKSKTRAAQSSAVSLAINRVMNMLFLPKHRRIQEKREWAQHGTWEAGVQEQSLGRNVPQKSIRFSFYILTADCKCIPVQETLNDTLASICFFAIPLYSLYILHLKWNKYTQDQQYKFWGPEGPTGSAYKNEG